VSNLPGIIEATAAAIVPLGGVVMAGVRWRSNRARERSAREEAARIAATTAAEEARREVRAEQAKTQAATDALMQNFQQQITQLRTDLASARADLAEKDRLLYLRSRGHKPGGEPT
jgi:hypothetical protein